MTRCTCCHYDWSWIPSLYKTPIRQCPQLWRGQTIPTVSHPFVPYCSDCCIIWALTSVASCIQFRLLNDQCFVVQSLANLNEWSWQCLIYCLLNFPVGSSLSVDDVDLLESLHLLILDDFPDDEAKINGHRTERNIKSSINFEAPIVNPFHLLFVVELLLSVLCCLGCALDPKLVKDVAEGRWVHFYLGKNQLLCCFGSRYAWWLLINLWFGLFRQHVPVCWFTIVLSVEFLCRLQFLPAFTFVVLNRF